MSQLYSVRMRSAEGGPHEEGGRHISGAERIVTAEELEILTKRLVYRALHHSKGQADFINIRIDAIDPDSIQYVDCLHIEEHDTSCLADSHKLGQELLSSYISELAIERAFTELLSLTDNMRGAILLDASTGRRLDRTNHRGIRVSHMDSVGEPIMDMNLHMREALVLASKVLSCKGIVGELCWSDDPDYTVGYVSCDRTYHRLQHMKVLGSPVGGRVFFVAPHTDIDEVIQYLENTNVLVRWS